MLTIRLQRIGKKNKVHFRLVLAEKTSAATKKFIEVLGSYNPHDKQLQLKDEARLKYWVSEHIAMSPTAHNLLVTHKFLDLPKVKAFTTPKKEVPVEAAPVEKATTEVTPAVENAPEENLAQPV